MTLWAYLALFLVGMAIYVLACEVGIWLEANGGYRHPIIHTLLSATVYASLCLAVCSILTLTIKAEKACDG